MASSLSPTTEMAISVALMVITLALNGYFLYFLTHLHGKDCACAMGWRRKFLEYSQALFIAVILLALLGFSASGLGILGAILSLVFLLIWLAYVVITRQYINELRDTGCSCATKKTAFQTLNVWNILQILLLLLQFVWVIFVLLFSRQVRPAPRR